MDLQLLARQLPGSGRRSSTTSVWRSGSSSLRCELRFGLGFGQAADVDAADRDPGGDLVLVRAVVGVGGADGAEDERRRQRSRRSRLCGPSTAPLQFCWTIRRALDETRLLDADGRADRTDCNVGLRDRYRQPRRISFARCARRTRFARRSGRRWTARASRASPAPRDASPTSPGPSWRPRSSPATGSGNGPG